MRAHKVTQRNIIKAEIKKGIEILVPAAANREKALANAVTKKISQKNRVEEGKMEN
jgi:hypothetical protein